MDGNWVTIVKDVLEFLYLLSGIGIIFTLVIGLNQIKLFKKDLETKNKRASVEKSIEYLNWFASDFIPKFAQYQSKLKEMESKKVKIKMDDYFFLDMDLNKEIITNAIKMSSSGGDNLINQLEFFSAAMISGLADEELAFSPLSKVFCESVEDFYILICLGREDKESNQYGNVIALYKLWKKRITKTKLEKEQKSLSEQLEKYDGQEKITSIGV